MPCVCSRTMQLLWSRYKDISSSCACIRTGTPDSICKTVDSDLVILVIRFFPTLGLLELLGWLREWENLRDIPIHDICSDLGPSDLWHCHFSMPSQGATATLHHTSLDVERRRLGHLGKIHQDSLKHCWHWPMHRHASALGLSTCRSWNDLSL